MTEYLTETAFTWGGPAIKFGVGALDEIGYDVARLGPERVLIVTDAGVAATGLPDKVRGQLLDAGLKAEVYDGAHVEPTDVSLAEAARAAAGEDWDGYVAVGGGSAIDTAKAINLLTACGGDVMDYVNPPIGEGRKPDRPLLPLIAVPTTSGTGAESTAVCVLDIVGLRLKSGISDVRLRPTLAVIDPLATLGLPRQVTVATGVDVLTHALEAYTARGYDAQRRKRADERVAYCGANPISDVWCERALTLLGGSFRRAVLNGADLAARTDMMLAATFAGLGFGIAGVHIPPGWVYPFAGRVTGYRPAGYPDAPLVPHGQSVGVTAPAAFRFTFPTHPQRHLRAAELLGHDWRSTAVAPADALPQALIDLFEDIGMPNGVSAYGYTEADIDDLVAGALKQQRLLVVAPRDVTPEALGNIITESMVLYPS
jgi:hydroxyacid-oxoacid transhydrogenase